MAINHSLGGTNKNTEKNDDICNLVELSYFNGGTRAPL